MTVFLNPVAESYTRFGGHKAPKYISWSRENRSQLVRIPAAVGEYRRAAGPRRSHRRRPVLGQRLESGQALAVRLGEG